MTTGNRAVTAALRRRLRPVLREAGFEDFTGRKAWRVEQEVISLVACIGLSAYTAGAIGCTSFSFGVEVGVFFRVFDRDLLRPQDYHSTFRAILGKTVRQTLVTPDRPDIWFVAPDGGNLDEVVADAVSVVQHEGFPELRRFSTAELAFDTLLHQDSTETHYGEAGLWMPGAPGSPHWLEVAETVGRLVLPDPASAIASAPILAQE